MIAAVVLGAHAIRVGGIRGDPVEIDHGVEVPRAADPLVDCLAIQLVAPLGMDYQLLQAASWAESVFGRLPEPPLPAS